MFFLMFINQQGAYEPVETCPVIAFKSLYQLQHIGCDGAECPIQAFYDREAKAIYLLDDLEMDDSFHKSILLHELVHYVQDINAKWEEGSTECQSGLRRELNAFQVQEKYLLSQNIRIPVSRHMAFYRC